MEKNHVFKYISEQELGDMLKAFHAITRLNIALIDENGRELLQYGEKYPYCTEFARHNKSGRNCAQEHVHQRKAVRLRGRGSISHG